MSIGSLDQLFEYILLEASKKHAVEPWISERDRSELFWHWIKKYAHDFPERAHKLKLHDRNYVKEQLARCRH